MFLENTTAISRNCVITLRLCRNNVNLKPKKFAEKVMGVMSKREYPDCPRVGVGAIVVKDGHVLLVKRAAAPNKGLWAIPGGSLKLGETLKDGAEREILEETGIVVDAGRPVYAFDYFERDPEGKIRFHFVIVDMLADYIRGEVKAADDALDARWLSPEDLKDFELSVSTMKILKYLKFIG